jgi:hypothetical protein
MFIILDTNDKDLEVRVYDALNDDDRFITDFSQTPDAGDTYVPGGSVHVLEASEQEPHSKIHIRRWTSLKLAALGVRLYSDKWDKYDPIFAGSLPQSDHDIRRLILDAKFAESRAEYFKSFGVNYIGRTNLTPRSIFVLDNKKGDPTHSPVENETLAALYISMPEDWWGSTSLVSSGNVEKLEKFMLSLEETVPLTFTTGGMAKLKFMALEYAHVLTPKPTFEYGVSLRQAVNRFSWI